MDVLPKGKQIDLFNVRWSSSDENQKDSDREWTRNFIQFENGHTNLDQLLVRSLMSPRLIEENGLSSARKCLKSQWIFGRMFFCLTSLFGSDGKVMVWRRAREEFHRKSTIPTIKQSSGSVMIWVCFTR